jgi:hypothetical protein
MTEKKGSFTFSPSPHATADFNIEAYGQDFYEIKVANFERNYRMSFRKL